MKSLQHHLAVDVSDASAKIRITDTAGRSAEVPLEGVEWLVCALISVRENLLCSEGPAPRPSATILPFRSRLDH